MNEQDNFWKTTSTIWVDQIIGVMCAFCGQRKHRTVVNAYNGFFFYWNKQVLVKKKLLFYSLRYPGAAMNPCINVHSNVCNWLDCLNQWLSWKCHVLLKNVIDLTICYRPNVLSMFFLLFPLKKIYFLAENEIFFGWKSSVTCIINKVLMSNIS